MEYLHGGFLGRSAARALPVSSVFVSMQDLELRYTWIRDPDNALREEDVVGKTDEDLLGSEDAARLAAIKKEVLASGRPQRRELMLTFRGARRWFDIGVHPERSADGHIVGVLCTAVDITEQKRSAQVLRQRAQRLALLYEAAAGLLATGDPMRFLEQLFAKLAVLFDLDVYAHYAVASDGSCLRLAASGGLSEGQRQAMARVAFGQPPCGAVAATRRPIIVSDSAEGDDFVAPSIRSLGLRSYVCHPLIAGGELFGTLAFGSQTVAEHTQESVGLLRAVSDLVALAIARQRAEQSLRDADRRKDLFLATLAHELRNPLAPLRSGIDLLQASTHDPGTISITLEVMERQVKQLTRLVDDLLEVSRITQGRLELRKSRVALDTIVESALEQTRALFDEAGHELVIELPEESMSSFVPDVVLLDIGMPGMNGYEVARRIRARGGTQPLLVALTGWGQAKDKARAAEAGFDRYLVKPIGREALQKLLAAAPTPTTA